MVDVTTDDMTESHVIQMKRCPRCYTTIRLSLRYGNVIKQQLQDIEKVKAEMHERTSSGLSMKKLVLRKRVNNLLVKFSEQSYERIWTVLARRVSKLSNGVMLALLENIVMLMERFCSLVNKWETKIRKLPLDVCKENNLDGKPLDTRDFLKISIVNRSLKVCDSYFSDYLLED